MEMHSEIRLSMDAHRQLKVRQIASLCSQAGVCHNYRKVLHRRYTPILSVLPIWRTVFCNLLLLCFDEDRLFIVWRVASLCPQAECDVLQEINALSMQVEIERIANMAECVRLPDAFH